MCEIIDIKKYKDKKEKKIDKECEKEVDKIIRKWNMKTGGEPLTEDELTQFFMEISQPHYGD
jgi:hypothetical protein